MPDGEIAAVNGKWRKMTDTKETKKGFDLSLLTQELGKYKRQFDSLGKVVDYIMVDVMKKVYKTNITKAYEVSMKQLDYISEHLI